MELWNLIIVDRYESPYAKFEEIQVESETILGAVMKGNKIVKREHPDSKIKSVWRLNRERLMSKGKE